MFSSDILTGINSPETVVFELVVAGERDKPSPSGGQGEEDLYGRIAPHLKRRGCVLRSAFNS